jgi:carbon starvation protein
MAVEALVAVMAITAVTTAFGSASELSASINVTGPVNTFSHGFGYITRFILGGYGAFIAIILLNSFILTTLDAATRIARYLLQEMFTTLDRFLATALIILAGGYLALSGSWQKVWPIFGAANQLTAALTMIVLSSWLLSRGKDVRITLIPAIFMLVTSVGALGWQFGKFLGGGDYFLIVVDTVLMALALSMLIEVRSHILSLARGKRGSRG